MTSASATSCTTPLPRRLEVLQDVVLGDLASFHLPSHVAAQHVVQLSLDVEWERQLRVRKEQSCDAASASDKNRFWNEELLPCPETRESC